MCSHTRIATLLSQPSIRNSTLQAIEKLVTLLMHSQNESLSFLHKKEELAQIAQISVNPTSMVEPVLTVVGHEHSLYYAYPRKDLVSGGSGVHVLGPDLDRFERLSTDSIRGVLKTTKVFVNLLKYGMDEYWGGFFRPVLNKLAGI
jgi:hypothetical protein